MPKPIADNPQYDIDRSGQVTTRTTVSPDGKTLIITTTYPDGQVVTTQSPNPNYQDPTKTSTSGVDWARYLGFIGLPQDVVDQVNSIFANTADPNQAAALALAYIRGTPWYATTYPGINDGIQKGLFGDEAGYRAYTNAINVEYQQYLGRAPTAAEITSYIGSGLSPNIVGGRLAGDAYVAANKNDIEYLAGAFTPEGRLGTSDLQQYGYATQGVGGSLGMSIDSRLKAAAAKMQDIFQGTLATPSLSLGNAGLASPSLGGTKAQTPDISA